MSICVELRYRLGGNLNKSILIYRTENPSILQGICSDAMETATRVIATTKQDDSGGARIAKIEAERVKQMIRAFSLARRTRPRQAAKQCSTNRRGKPCNRPTD